MIGDRALTINRLGENRLLIVLCEQDIADSALDFKNINFADSRQREGVITLMRRACVSSGIETGGKRVNIEALPLEKSCYLLVTVGIPRRYRLKKSCPGLCYSFCGSDSFLRAVEQLYRQNVYCAKNSAYALDGEYFLIFDYPKIPKPLQKILSEYGKRHTGRLKAARIKETAKPLCEHNAIAVIGKHLV